MEVKTEGGLTEAETAYFESEGETHFEPAPVETGEETKQAETPVETTEEAAPAVEEQPKGARKVDIGALHEERSKRKELEQELSTIKQNQAVLADRWNTLLAASAQPEQKADEPPNPDDDIFGYSKWQAEQLAQLKSKIEGQEKQTKEQAEAVEFEAKVWDHWHQSAAQFKAQTPEFEDAVKWMSETRSKQLKALGGLQPQFKTDAGITQQINRELKDIVVVAAQNGVSPAEYIYSMAKEWGFQGKKPEPKTDLPEKLANVDKAQQKSRTISNASGQPAGDQMTIEGLSSMPQSEFNEWMKVPANEALFRQLMGG